jgi:general secretion pathway protein E
MGIDQAQAPTLYRPPEDLPASEGFRGRTGIYEVVSIDDEMRTMIHDGASEHQLENYARTRSQSIRDDGMRRVMEGDTTLEEVLRVARGD